MKRPKTVSELKEFLTLKSAVAIFGAGPGGRRLLGACKSIGILPTCFLDNFKTGSLLGLPIIRPSTFVLDNPDGRILLGVISEKANVEVSGQLAELHFPVENQILFREIAAMFAELDAEINWANGREDEYDWHKNDRYVELLSAWIEENDTSVADLGCGKTQLLRNLIPEGCNYMPVDYISRSSDTIVCDFNADKLPKLSVDVAFASGILSLVRDTERFLRWICNTATKK